MSPLKSVRPNVWNLLVNSVPGQAPSVRTGVTLPTWVYPRLLQAGLAEATIKYVEHRQAPLRRSDNPCGAAGPVVRGGRSLGVGGNHPRFEHGFYRRNRSKRGAAGHSDEPARHDY